MTAPQSKQAHAHLAATIFTPSQPIRRLDVFTGRIEQIFEITAALNVPGRHVVLYGERGVGKTSLANLLAELARPSDNSDLVISHIVNCASGDTFKTVWEKVFRALHLDVPDSWLLKRSPDPEEIREILSSITSPMIIVLDEYDRIVEPQTIALMADTIKVLSDKPGSVKLVIVGVAESIVQLVGNHESVQRATEEILMPRMDSDEIEEIVTRGFDLLKMTIDQTLVSKISGLAEGLPHYAHILSLGAAQNAIQDDRSDVSAEDIDRAIGRAIRKHSLASEYQTAIESPHRDNLYTQVLTACALAEKNRLGYFTAASVKGPLSKIVGKEYQISAFSRHLKQFTESHRGPVLQQSGPARRSTYRFKNPLLQPYVILTAIEDGLIAPTYATDFKLAR